jgi:hypothetical protein
MKTSYVVWFCAVFCTPWLQIAYNTKIISSAFPHVRSDPEDRGIVVLRNDHMYVQVYSISEPKSRMPRLGFQNGRLIFCATTFEFSFHFFVMIRLFHGTPRILWDLFNDLPWLKFRINFLFLM